MTASWYGAIVYSSRGDVMRVANRAPAVIIGFSLILSVPSAAFALQCRFTTAVRFLATNGSPASGISAEQLKVEVGGSPAKVVSVAPGVKPVMILLIDTSGSMAPTWAQAISAAKQLAGTAGDQVAAIVFREEIKDHASGAAETNKLLDRLAAHRFTLGGTALYDTLISTAAGVKNRDSVLVAITDGGDDASRNSSEQTIKLFLKSRWPPVFGLVLDYAREHTHRAYFNKVVTSTGGLAAYPASASKVLEAANELSGEIYAPFLLTLETSQAVAKPAKLSVEVVDERGKPRHDVQVAHAADVAGCD